MTSEVVSTSDHTTLMRVAFYFGCQKQYWVFISTLALIANVSLRLWWVQWEEKCLNRVCDFNFSTSYCHSPRVYTFILIESAQMQAVEQIRFKCSSESGTAIKRRRCTILSEIIAEGQFEFFRDGFSHCFDCIQVMAALYAQLFRELLLCKIYSLCCILCRVSEGRHLITVERFKGIHIYACF